MKQTAVAPSNIAFIKYWGKQDEVLRLPLNSSISMNIDGAETITTVEFSSEFQSDRVELMEGNFNTTETERVIHALDRIRNFVRHFDRARVITKNSFPKGAGVAASASGFAALTVAAFSALSVPKTEKELTVFSRLGSGSACRSIPDGFVEWVSGRTSGESYAYSLYPHTYWNIRDVLVIVDYSMKKVPTTEGMESVQSSPNLSTRLDNLPSRLARCKAALADRNFSALGEVIEEECLDMHTVMQTQIPPLMYWNITTQIIMSEVKKWRSEGIPVYFTIDAGPNVHLICEAEHEQAVIAKAQSISGIKEIIQNKPAPGARLVPDHLF